MLNNGTSEFNIFKNYRNINITSITHVNDTYIINLLEKSPKLTFIQSFLMTFITLLGDETFILLIILRQQFSQSYLIIFAFLTSLLFLNTINVLFGRSLDLLLYQNFIDVFAMIIYCIISVRHFLRFFDKRKRLTYLKEIELIIKPDMIIEEEENDDINKVHHLISTKSCVNIHEYDSINKNNEIEYNEEYIYQKYYEGHNKGFLFFIFAKTIFISVFGDSYMLAIISNSAISNFRGALFGSSLGILIIVYLACNHGMFIGSHLSEGKMGVVISFLYFSLAAEIFCFNKYLNINI